MIDRKYIELRSFYIINMDKIRRRNKNYVKKQRKKLDSIFNGYYVGYTVNAKFYNYGGR